VLLFLVLIVAVTLTRSRPTKKAPGLQPRLTALAGTFLLLGLVLFPRNEATMAMNLLSAGLIVSGNLLAVYVLFWLGRSFSVMAEARRLVTGGPYALIRHPLYVAEEIAILGVFVVYASPWTAILFTVHLALQIQRMRNEEEILCRAFPAYQDYMTRTARLIPRLY
jgi:protein-S-isoprenylcysteine O-methyltransferase Ste14